MFLVLPLVVILISSRTEAQQTPLDSLLNSLARTEDIRQVAISPDAQHLAWIESGGDDRGIFVCALASPESTRRRITINDGEETSDEFGIAWSPDSRQLAFLSPAQTPGQSQLYVAKISGGEARKVTDLTGSLAAPAWSPDGKTIALLYIENAPRRPGPLEPMPLPSGVMGNKIYQQRLTTVDVGTGKVRQISPGDQYVYEFDWSPDGRQFALVAARGEGDANWWTAQIETLQLDSGRVTSVCRPDLQVASPRWSPDGKSIAFIGGLMSDEGSIGGDLFLVPASGGGARNLAPGLKATVESFAWKPGGKQILLSEGVEGASGIATLDVGSGQIAPVWQGPETISSAHWSFGPSMASDGITSAMVRESYSRPPEVWAGDLGKWHQMSRLQKESPPAFGRTESVHWRNDGRDIQGWLSYPIDYNASKRYPVAVEVHGGPGAMARPTWPSTFFDFSLLTPFGYFVFRPNPRGSFGEGESLTRANVKDFGYGDLRDILAGVDYVVQHYPVDGNRVGIGGWSYGGYMAMWAVTQTQRFHAAVAGAGIANWQSYYGENDIGQWMVPFFGDSVYSAPLTYVRASPMTYIKNAKTPTLILVGDRDGECPAAQSFEFWHALQTLGVENRFIVYPNEGHAIYDFDHRRDIMQQTLDWFDSHLK